ncbi:MAG: 4-hydroxythreonine-4-phosphate dehydrogenase PdxA [Candidatus Omnitrophica bacterium]|nr:4-hydroxythreonine-4-phosphate dehydrogenase PdxA [Candidatus Omnitrophota bacterium]MDE2223005.1 4-hydroxythreonine-4-phosphate dehydrogenase PdxA [Candidatus Omnitrophota bacterium]
MLKSNKKVVAVTMGDPRGIGAEIIRKALGQKRILAQGHFIVIGDKKKLGRLPSCVEIISLPYKSPGEGSVKFLDEAIALIKAGKAQALVTAPLSKEAVSRHVKDFVGHTEYLARAFGVKNFDMMFAAQGVFLTIVTRHVPLQDVPRLITGKKVFDSIVLMDRTLKDKFKIASPKIAVLGLNPHAGESGLLGSEDLKRILPAVKKAGGRGIKAYGPLPADTFFAFPKRYEGIIAMYHDQGLAPFKGLYMKELVNFTAGLPFVRTSPAHGTAFDIAGQNKADPSSMIAALLLACRCA